MQEKLLTIREAAHFLGVSIDTLRRWDKNGKLVAIRKEGGTHRYYRQKDLEIFASDLVKLAYNWVTQGGDVHQDFYCANSAVFQARLSSMQLAFLKANTPDSIALLVVAISGEIGNNSFDHNLGKWPDISGIFFGYDATKHKVVLADRGLGVLTTLKRVRPNLENHTDALRTAFTEILSGRAPEARGNGLKFVRKVIAENPISLFFQSGDAELRIKKDNPELFITRAASELQGCFAIIEY